MNRNNGSPDRVEERQPKKHKPKRKVSELDEIAAKVSKPALLRGHGMLTVHTAETNSGLSCSASLQTTQGRYPSIFKCTDR
jgi:hypothetical protein